MDKREFAIKVGGLSHVLDAVDQSRLRLCIGFGSMTARTGLRGESHYAFANELMVRALEEWGRNHPDCRCVGIEWSVWAGTGMGDRLGRLAALESAGITLLKGDLRGILRARRLSRATMRNIRQNLFFALIYNAVGIPLAAGALYPLWGIRLSPIIAAAATAAANDSDGGC